MSKISEKSYGARLRAAKDLVVVLSRINYIPARPTESIAEITALFTQAETSNNTITTAQQIYNTANKARAAIFRTDTQSVIKLLPVIRKYIDALYGKTSIEANQISTIINKLRSKPATVIPATADSEERTISNSEMSYGSMTQNFTNLVTNLVAFQAYNPAIPHITIAALQTKLTEISMLNDMVIRALTDLRLVRAQRNIAFPDLHDRCLRIKALIEATFGKDSQEYKSIKGLKI